MKRIILFLLGAAGGLSLALLAIAGFVSFKASQVQSRSHAVSLKPGKVPSDPASLSRGRHLAETRGCVDCHGRDLGGQKVMDNGAMGRVYGPNLTRGKGGLPADYGDVDWERAIRHGVARDGRGLFLMPSTDYARFSEGDMGSLLAYLKSLAPVDRERVPVALGPVARALVAFGKIKLAADEIDHARVQPALVTPGLTVEYGRYIADSCTGCHREDFAGGKIASGPPEWPPAANLTPHPDGRLSKWAEADFMKAMRTGKRPDGTEINPAMPPAFGQMDDVELKSLWIFLKTVPPMSTLRR